MTRYGSLQARYSWSAWGSRLPRRYRSRSFPRRPNPDPNPNPIPKPIPKPNPNQVLVALFSEAAGDTVPPDGASAGDLGAPKSELRRRGVVGPTLPPERLCLEHVEYDRDHDASRELKEQS